MPDIQRSKASNHDHAQLLQAHGYCVIPGLIDGKRIAQLDRDLAPIFEQTPFCEGGFYGERTKRFGRLLTRAPVSAKLVQHPQILSIAQILLGRWCDQIQLNLTQAIEIHPGAVAQAPHRDQDMWHGPKGICEYVLNVMWPLTAFTAKNGATVIWPGSHGPAALELAVERPPIIAECNPGDAILFLGSTLHHAGANRTAACRRGIVVGYSLGWLKAYENPYLAYPPSVARHFSAELAALIGYRQHRPNLGNFEGQCPSILLRDEMPSHLPAVDALLPEQVEMIRVHAASQRETLRLADCP